MITSDEMSALLSAKWDWSTGAASKKQSRTQEAYKLSTRRAAAVNNLESAYPFSVVDTRLRIPGTGRSLVVRYESSAGKDFVLIGHTLIGIERTDSEARK